MMLTDMQDMQTSKFPAKKTMMGKSGVGRGIAGIIGDVLLQSSGFAPIYSPALAQRRESEAQRAAMEEKRAYDERQWMRRKEYERDNPAPSEFERMLGRLNLPQDRATKIISDWVDNRANPPVYRQDPATGGYIAIERPTNLPPIGSIVPDPRKQGGPAQQAPGGFSGYPR